MKLKSAEKRDILFILNGINEICKIEKQKVYKKSELIKIIKSSLRKKEIKIAIDKNKVVGFIQFKFSKLNPYGIDYGKYEKKYCWIDWMYVSKEFRGKGIGRSLHNYVRSICKKKNISEIMLDVFKVNKNAIKFYKKEGFIEFIHILKEKIK